MIVAADPPLGTGLALYYDVNVLGKIVRVRDGSDGIPVPTQDPATPVPASLQKRVFTYDRHGLLRDESHPERIQNESNPDFDIVTRYPLYDAKGNVVHKREEERRDFGTIIAAYDNAYDVAGRLTSIAIGGVPYLTNTYDGQAGSGGSYFKGKLTRRVGYNLASTPAESVTDTFDYAGRAGRMNSRTTLFGNGFSTVQGWTYNTLGLVEDHLHARTSGSYRSTAKLKAGLPYSVTTDAQPLVTQATYAPSGALTSYSTANGVVTTITQDASGIARPSEIKAMLGANTLFSTGTYGYDGTGNITGSAATCSATTEADG